MNLLFHYPANCVGRPIDPTNMWTDARGLTGSEMSCFRYALEMGKRGHVVRVVSNFTHELQLEDTNVLMTPNETSEKTEWDAALAWMAPDILKDVRSPFRLFNQQCNDFGGCTPGWEVHTDAFCPLSHTHARLMGEQTGYPKSLYRVMPNGVDLNEFKPTGKKPGKIIWASSHDRGLHWLLELWPALKAKVPHAELHVFYDTSGIVGFSEMPEQPEGSPTWMNELKRRSCFQMEALDRLQHHGVILHGSVSRDRIRAEMADAEIMAYPCDPVRYGVETFGVSVLEAMASGCVPVLCFADAFAELWSGSCPGVFAPYPQHKSQYLELLIKVLQNHPIRIQTAVECRAAAQRYDWSVLADQLERTLETKGHEGFGQVNW